MAPFQKLAVRSCARAVRLYITSSMQLAGFSCCFCDRSVVLYSDATGCSGCKSVAHKTCLSVAGHLCPQCTTSWRNFEDGIACSQRCPSCGEHFSSSQLHYCIKCGTQTSWDSREEYLAARGRIRRLGVGSAVLGAASLLASMPCMAVSTSIVWCWHRMFPPDVCETAIPFMLGAILAFGFFLATAVMLFRVAYLKFRAAAAMLWFC